MTDDIKLQFEGFSPSLFVKNYFTTLLEDLRDESPSWSSVRATIHRVGREFRGVVKISSHAGEFFAVADAVRVTQVGRKLTQRMRRQLGKWKSKRFGQERGRR